jgi:hypothetical protein
MFFHPVLVIPRGSTWEEWISSAAVREKWGDVETITTKLMGRHLEWLGHLARIISSRSSQLWRSKTEIERP